MVIVYFNVQGVVDPRDDHCLQYIGLRESMGLRVTFGSTTSPTTKKIFIFIFINIFL